MPESASAVDGKPVSKVPGKSRQLKRFVRKGVPQKYRARVWMAVSGAEEMRARRPNLYLEMLAVRVSGESTTVQQITVDLHR